MPTGAQTGFTRARRIGSAPDSSGLSPYSVATGYSTGLGRGDPVKLTTDGTLVVATNGADAIGILEGVKYVGSDGSINIKHNWPASTTATNIEALVIDDPNATFAIKGNGPIPLVQPGDIFAVAVGTPNAYTGRSSATATVLPVRTGSLDITGQTDMGANLTGIDDADTFTIRTSNNTATTITIGTTETTATFLAQLNAVDGIVATVTGSGYLSITSDNGYDIVLADGTGTPLADSPTLIGAAGTITAVVAANAGLVKVVKVLDLDSYQMEVVLVNHSLRDDG